MIQSVNPSNPIDPIKIPQENAKEKQKLFEIQFEINVLSAFVSVTEQNNSTKQQLSKLKNDLASGKSFDLLASDINQVIAQINIGSNKKDPLPSFIFSSESNQGISQLCLTLEKFLKTATKQKSLGESGEKIFENLSLLIHNSIHMTQGQSLKGLNKIIEEVNHHLPTELQL